MTVTSKDQRRIQVLNDLHSGAITAQEASGLLGLSVRQIRRLLVGYRQDGVAAIPHGNRGRPPAHTIDETIRARVLELARTRYAGCNQHHLTDLLAEREGLHLSRSTVQRILVAGGIHAPRTHRVPEHRHRRERYAKEGMLLQLDGSPHAWLEDRGPRLCLLLAIDDATGTIPAAVFREQEDAQGYFLVLSQVLSTKGRPLAVYHDQHTIFLAPSRKTLTIADELAGRTPMTQVGRALAALDIRAIPAHSPQAKGRVEHCFGTVQDRLTSELRLAGAATMAEATAVLEGFLPRYNRQFGVPAREAGSAYRPIETGCELASILCFHYERTVGADNTVKLGEQRIQLQPGRDRPSYARARVLIQERLDGSLVVQHNGMTIATTPAPAEAPVLRARAAGRPKTQQHDEQEHRAEDVAVAVAAVEGVGMWAAQEDEDAADHEPGRPHIHAPAQEPRTHPWRRSYKTMITPRASRGRT